MISYLQVENLTKTYGEVVLFENISFSVNKDEKIALIAKNGTGKTTLLNIIAGLDTPDKGKISFRRDINIGYLEQEPLLNENLTVIEQVLHHSSDVFSAILEYEKAVALHDKNLLEKASQKMDAFQAWDFEVKVKQILDKLGLSDFTQKVAELSGGQRKRLALAAAIVNEPDLLILDEPTNHLDMQMIEWLEMYLAKSKCTLLMVTHDRYFLDRVCNEIIEMEDNTIYTYKGNYSYYVERRQERIQATNSTIERANNLLRVEADWMGRQPQARATKAKYRIENYYKLKETAKQKFEDEKLEINVKTSRLGKKILDIHDLCKSFGEKVILNNFSHSFNRYERIGIIGSNGVGKSTFLNVVTGALQADSGRIEVGETIVFGYYTQKGIKLKENQRVIDVIKEIAEIVTLANGKTLSASQFLEHFLFPPDMQYSVVAKLSGGEKRRLYLMTILMQNPNFLILDEPTNDLDIMTLNVLEDYLMSFSGCVLIVSHDRFFVDKVVDYLFVFEGNGKILNFPGNYSDYQYDLTEREREEKLAEKAVKTIKEKPVKISDKKFAYKEKREYELLEKEIAQLSTEKAELEISINSGTLKSDELIKKSNRFSEVSTLLDEKEMRWLELDMLKNEE